MREPCDGGLNLSGFSSTMGLLCLAPAALLLFVDAWRTMLVDVGGVRQSMLLRGSRKRGMAVLEDICSDDDYKLAPIRILISSREHELFPESSAPRIMARDIKIHPVIPELAVPSPNE